MDIILTGFMGTGKSTVGRRVAAILNRPFYDLDHQVEKQGKLSVPQIFEQRGEAAFRDLETAALRDLPSTPPAVIATGGGILLKEENRHLLKQRGLVICLTATVSTLLNRIKNPSTRPLLAGGSVAEKLEQLLRERETVYAECSVQIPTDGRMPDEIAQDVIQRFKAESSS